MSEANGEAAMDQALRTAHIRQQRLDMYEKVRMLEDLTKAEIEAARDALAAELRWKGVRHAYAELYAQMLAEYGDKQMPPWNEKLRGPKPVLPASQGGV